MNTPTTPPRPMRGADGTNPGAAGYVPAPAAADNVKLLHGDGAWKAVSNASAATDAEAIAGTVTTKFLTPANGVLAAMRGLSSRAPAPYHLSDGATANCGLIQGPFVAGSRGWLAGAPVAEWCGWVTWPTTTAGGVVAAISSSTTGNFHTTPHSLYLAFGASNFEIVQVGAANVGNARIFTHSTLRTLFAGQRKWMRVRLWFGATNPVVEVDGVDISSGFSLTTPGTFPDWLSTSLASTYHWTGYNWPSGELPSGAWLTGHLTSAESLSWMITGQPPAWVLEGGHMSFAGTVFATGFGSTIDSFTGASVSGFTAVESTGGLGAAVTYLPRRSVGSPAVRVLFDAVLTSGAVPTIALSDVGIASGSLTSAPIVAGANDISLIPTRTYNGLAFQTSGNTSYQISNFRVVLPGALSLLTPQAIPVAHDWTEIGGNDARCVGVRGVTDDPVWVITTDTTSAAAGGQAALGGDVLDSTRDVIDSIVQLPTVGTPTTSIGHSTLWLATYVPTGSLSSGINPRPLAVRKLESNQVWIYQSTTAVIRTVLKGHRAN